MSTMEIGTTAARVAADHGSAGLVYLSGSGLDLAVAADDVRGMVVVDPEGHRLGEVGDLVIDVRDRRARILSVVSGGILGLAAFERLIPVETIAKVDERIRVDRTYAEPVGPVVRTLERSWSASVLMTCLPDAVTEFELER